MTTTDYVAGEMRAALARRRLTGVGLAQQMDKSQRWISRRLTGEVQITVDDLYAIAGALHEDPRNLLPQMDSNHQPAGNVRVVRFRPGLATYGHITATAA